MARLPYLNQEDLGEEDRPLLNRPANLFRVLVHSPEAFRQYSRLGGWIRNSSKLDPRLREMAILQVGYTTGCAYEYTHHIPIGRTFGVSDDDIRAIAADSAGRACDLLPLDRAVLRLAREMTIDGKGSSVTFAELQALLSAANMTDLVMTIAYYNLTTRLIFTLDIDLEPEYEGLLTEFPLGVS